MDYPELFEWKRSVVDGREIMTATIPCGPFFSAKIRHDKPHRFSEQDIFVHSTVALVVATTDYQIVRFATRTSIVAFSVELATAKLLEGVMSVFREADNNPGHIHRQLRELVHSDLRMFQDAIHQMNAPFFFPPHSPDAQPIQNHSEGGDFR